MQFCFRALALGTVATLTAVLSAAIAAEAGSQPRTAAYEQDTTRHESNIRPVAGQQTNHLQPSVFLSVDRLPAGKTCRIAVVLDVEQGWHINTNPANPGYLVPTTVSMNSTLGTTLKEIKFPPGAQVSVEGIDQPLHVYDGRAILVGELAIPAAAAGQTEEMSVEIKFQACNASNCLAPKTVKLTGKVPVVAPQEQVSQVNQQLFTEADRILNAAKEKPTQQK